MNVRFIPTDVNYLNDVREIPRAFYPHIVCDENSENFLKWECEIADEYFEIRIVSDVLGEKTERLEIKKNDDLIYKKITKRFFKNCFYDYLKEKFGELPYGSLTGVRPTKVYYDNMDKKDVKGYLKKEYGISESRVELIEECVLNQRGIINESEDNIGLFINIPFCPTRCSYCSFISAEVGKVKKILPEYVGNILSEIDAVLEDVKASGKTVTSVYCGGGTPLSIGEYLYDILKKFADFNVEFTVEAGRPDCFNAEIIDMLRECNVTRISVNPQTFSQKTLDIIGRKHTVDDIYAAYELASGKFDVNMDLIAGLPGENADDFALSLEKTIALKPENITLHTLSLKRGSILTRDGIKKSSEGIAAKMMGNAFEVLRSSGYSAYYMYRLKNTVDNLENVGFSVAGKQCKYNIDMMEESQSIIGMGAGAMTKIIEGNRIERICNPKFVKEYGERISGIIETKSKLFSKRQ